MKFKCPPVRSCYIDIFVVVGYSIKYNYIYLYPLTYNGVSERIQACTVR